MLSGPLVATVDPTMQSTRATWGLAIVLALAIGDAAQGAATTGREGRDEGAQLNLVRDAPDPVKGVAPTARAVARWPQIDPLRRNLRTLPAVGVPRSGGTSAKAAAVVPPGPVTATGPTIPVAPPKVRPMKTVANPRPGMPITFAADGTGDADGQVTAYDWTIEADGATTQLQGPQVEFPTALTTALVKATLKVTDNDGNVSATTLTVPVVANTPPIVSLDRFKKHIERKMKTSGIVGPGGGGATVPTYVIEGVGGTETGLKAVMSALRVEQGFPTNVYANAADGDGQVIGYEYDVDDADGDFELKRGATDELRYVPAFTGAEYEKVLRVRVTDDEGATTTAELPLKVQVPCSAALVQDATDDVTVSKVSGCVTKPAASGFGGKTVKVVDGVVDVNGLQVAAKSASVSWNGHLVVVKSPNAVVSAVDGSGARLVLDQGPVTWKIAKGAFLSKSGPKLDGATIAGLQVAGTSGLPTMAKGRFAATIMPATPAVYAPAGKAGQTGAEPVAFKALTPKSAQGAGPAPAFSFGPTDLDVGGVALTDAYISFDGDDTWRFGGKATFMDITIEVDASIIDGDFGRLHGALISKSGIQTPIGLTLYGIDFEMQRADPKPTKCVPHVGVERISLEDLRKMFASYGYSKAALDKLIPDIEADYKVPDFQLCGFVDFGYGSFDGKDLVRGDISIGYRTYPDKTKVFGVKGKATFLGLGNIKLLFETYNDGYLQLAANANFKFLDGAVSVDGGLDFEARSTGKQAGRYNARVYADVCVKFGVNACAGGTVLVSSRGIGGCLGIDTALGEWTPGATYVYKSKDITPYFHGCDIGDVRETIKRGGNVTYKAVPAPGAAGVTAHAAQASETIAAGSTVSYPVRTAPTGIAVGVTGAGGLAHFTVIDPEGKAYEATAVDDNAQHRIVRANEPSHVFKSPEAQTTNVVVRGTSAVSGGAPVAPTGTWKVVIADDSVPVTKVVWSEGVQKPRASGTVARGDRGQMRLALKVSDRRSGVVARVVESGSSGSQSIASVPVTAGATIERAIRFRSGAANARERRQIDVYFERHGLPVGTARVARFLAPSPAAPAVPEDVRISRDGASLQVVWKPVPGASGYLVGLRYDDGRTAFRTVRTAKLRKRAFLRGFDQVHVTVQAVNGLNRRSAAAKAVLARRSGRPAPSEPTAAERKAFARMDG